MSTKLSYRQANPQQMEHQAAKQAVFWPPQLCPLLLQSRQTKLFHSVLTLEIKVNCD